MGINPSVLRIVWSVVESVPSNNLLSSSDTALVSTVVDHTSNQTPLSEEDVYSLSQYIRSKISLIRDVADARRSEAA